MKVVLVAVLSILMVMESRHHNGSTCTATCSRCIGAVKHNTILGQLIDAGSYSQRITITAKRWTFIIGNKENDIPLSRFRSKRW